MRAASPRGLEVERAVVALAGDEERRRAGDPRDRPTRLLGHGRLVTSTYELVTEPFDVEAELSSARIARLGASRVSATADQPRTSHGPGRRGRTRLSVTAWLDRHRSNADSRSRRDRTDLGVKGSQVQILSARQIDAGQTHFGP